MSTTLAQLEQKVNVMQQIRDHPWASIGIAVGAGAALGAASNRYRGSVDALPMVRAQRSRVAGLLDGVMVYLLRGLRQVAEQQIDGVLMDLKASLNRQGSRGEAERRV